MNADLSRNLQLTQTQIAARAYEIYLQRGREHGHAQDDWLQAEYELMQLPVDKIAAIEPHKSNASRTKKSALVSVVQAALLLSATGLTGV